VQSRAIGIGGIAAGLAGSRTCVAGCGKAGFRLAFVCMLAATGCADLSFKPGASPGEIQRDELACRDVSGEDEVAYASCMKERGYLVSKTGESLDWAPASR